MKQIKVFSKEWFKKYNHIITKVARLPLIGEWIFCFKKFGHYVDRKKIVEITPNSVVEFVRKKGKKVELRQHFFVRNEYALRLRKVFYPIWITFHIWDLITKPFPQLNLEFDTFEPQTSGGGSNTCCDGVVYGPSCANTWSKMRDGVGSAASNDGTLAYCASVQAANTTNYWGTFYRGFFSFDTSSLDDSEDIISACLSLYVYYVASQLGKKIAVCKSLNQASLNNVVINDYYNTRNNTTRVVDDVNYSSCTASQYNNFDFNSTGIAFIKKNGVTGLTVKHSSDADNSAPTWASGNPWDALRIYFSDNGSNKPKL